MSDSKGRSWPRSRRIVNAVNPFLTLPNALDRGARRHFCLDQLQSAARTRLRALRPKRRRLSAGPLAREARPVFAVPVFGNLCDWMAGHQRRVDRWRSRTIDNGSAAFGARGHHRSCSSAGALRARDQLLVSGEPGLSRTLAETRSGEFLVDPPRRCDLRSLAQAGKFL